MSDTAFMKKVTDLADNPIVKGAAWVIIVLCVFILKGWHAEAMSNIEQIRINSEKTSISIQADIKNHDAILSSRGERIIRLEENYKKLDENIHRVDDNIKSLSRQIERVADKVGAKKE